MPARMSYLGFWIQTRANSASPVSTFQEQVQGCLPESPIPNFEYKRDKTRWPSVLSRFQEQVEGFLPESRVSVFGQKLENTWPDILISPFQEQVEGCLSESISVLTF